VDAAPAAPRHDILAAPAHDLGNMETVETTPASDVKLSIGRRLRVLMLIDNMRHGGGAERAMVGLAMHLPKERCDVMVGTTRVGSGPLTDAVHAAGIPYFALNRRNRLDVAPFRQFVAFLRRQRIDVIHAHMFGSNLWGSVFGRLAGVPVVIAHEHSWSYEGQRVRRFLDGHVTGRLANAFVAVSERDRARMISLEGVPSEKIVVLPNPYIPRPVEQSVDIRAALGLSPETPLVGTMAVLRPEKALHVLLEAVAHLSGSIADLHLGIAGDGPCRASLEALAVELEIAERVHFLGWWDDVGGVLEALDVAAMCSDREGAPLFAIECMAHRTPLVSTDVGNVGDVLEDGKGVVLVGRRDALGLGAALESLLRDPPRRAAQAAAAAEHLERYQIDNVAREFADLYERHFARVGGTSGRA
jgi:glycosyltransferase involved in cell wall biosynthesis